MSVGPEPVLQGGGAGEAGVLRFPGWELPHGFSTRLGGVSQGPYAALNIGLTTRDEPERVAENRRRLGIATGMPLVTCLSMVHGSGVVRLDALPRRPVEGDAVITAQAGLPLMITTADCVPLFFRDPVRGAVGLAHAGWRGTVGGVARATVQALVRELGCRASDLEVVIGPSIGPCCFEVQGEVVDAFFAAFPGKELALCRGNSVLIDLWRANLEDLLEGGVDGDKVWLSRICTSCREDLFFSYRRDRGVTGRMAAQIALC